MGVGIVEVGEGVGDVVVRGDAGLGAGVTLGLVHAEKMNSPMASNPKRYLITNIIP